jgi:hypothetical protein
MIAAHQRDGYIEGANAVARDAARGVGGVETGGGSRPKRPSSTYVRASVAELSFKNHQPSSA